MENKGNPYHDEQGRFTSKGQEGSKTEQQSSPLTDLYGSLMKTANKLFPDKVQVQISEKDFDDKELEEDIDSTIDYLQLGMERMGLDENELPEVEEIVDSMPEFYKNVPDLKERVQKVLNSRQGKKEEPEEEPIYFDSDVEVNLPDGGSERIYIKNLGSKLLEFLEGDVQINDEQKQFIKENDVLPKSLNPYESDEELQEEFKEWLKDNYYSDKKDKSDYDFERGFVKGMKGGDY